MAFESHAPLAGVELIDPDTYARDGYPQRRGGDCAATHRCITTRVLSIRSGC